MARLRRGALKRQPTEQGTSNGVAFIAGGENCSVRFTGESESWDEGCPTEGQRFLMEKINCGEWTKDEPPYGVAAAVSPNLPCLAVAATAARSEPDRGTPRRSATSSGGSR